nr:hypothetical protein [Tanacetum cinerariifolium]
MAVVEVPQTLEYRDGQLNVAHVLEMNFSPIRKEDFQDSPDNEEDTRSSHEYLNDLEEEYQKRALWLSLKDYSKRNKGLITKTYERDEEKVSLDDNEMVEVKILMALAEENDDVSKEGARNGKWVKISMRKRILGVDQLTEDSFSSRKKDHVFIKSSADDQNCPYLMLKDPGCLKLKVLFFQIMILVEYSQLSYKETQLILLLLSLALQRLIMILRALLPPLKKLDGDEPIFEPKTIKSFLRPKSTFKAETLKGVIINELSSALAKDDKMTSKSNNSELIMTNGILNDNLSEHSNHNNDEQIIDNLSNTIDIQIIKHASSPYLEDISVQDTISIPNPPLSITSVVTPAPQDKWSQDKHIELVNIIGNLGVGMLTRAISKQFSPASAHECLFVDFSCKEEPKKVFEALKHPGWVDAMQNELNQFARNKVWTLVPTPYGKTITGSK